MSPAWPSMDISFQPSQFLSKSNPLPEKQGISCHLREETVLVWPTFKAKMLL